MCSDMLGHLGIERLRLMTNNPLKVDALSALGIDVVERVPIHAGRNPHNEHYLVTKEAKMGHFLATHQDDEV
jgi:GTP cyclohydrolase II